MVITECNVFDLCGQVQYTDARHTHLISFFINLNSIIKIILFGIFMRILSLQHVVTTESNELSGHLAAPKFSR